MEYTLDDGEALHREFPDTFWLPPADQRNALRPGQLVKLIFRIDLGDKVQVERMWVIVKNREDDEYLGELNNDPYCTDELRSGAPVRFEPRHVIDIYQEESVSS